MLVLQLDQTGKEFFSIHLGQRLKLLMPPCQRAVFKLGHFAGREETLFFVVRLRSLLHGCTIELTQATGSCTPANPRTSAILDIAWIIKAICSSRSTPNSSAPLNKSSRFTPAAKPLVFIFLRTELASSPMILLLGRTSAVAVIIPVTSSQA